MKTNMSHLLVSLVTAALSMSAIAEENIETIAKEESSSPWLFTPLISSDPKMKTSIGAMAAYMHTFDKKSPVSMFGVMANYSSSDSYVGGLFGNTYFNEDKQRIMFVSVVGNINNDYKYSNDSYNDIDEITVKTTDQIHMTFLRFSQHIWDDWFLGAQIVDSNYDIKARDEFSAIILDRLNLHGFNSSGIGLLASFDSRDNQQSPSNGVKFLLHNFAFREALGAVDSFDAYMLDYNQYFSHGEGHVAAVRIKSRWTHNAPNSGFSSIELRGYVRGQNLAEHTTLIEIEERYVLNDKWGIAAFTGIACLYGNDLQGNNTSCSDSDNLYPAAGVGAIYAIKPEEKMVIRADFAIGKGDNYGFYLNFGQPF